MTFVKTCEVLMLIVSVESKSVGGVAVRVCMCWLKLHFLRSADLKYAVARKIERRRYLLNFVIRNVNL